MADQNGAASDYTVKLFVGQVPRQMTEEELLPIFQEAGSVQEISIIKDKVTKASRGCCFLIYTSKEEADNAIALFHNKRKLPPLSTPLQVKYADGELERLEHKLFIGMLPKTISDSDIAAVFSQFGAIKELTVIKGSQASKACAFLKFETREQAMAAIKALNDTYKMEGSSSALVVKWADTEKERQSRKQQRAQAVPATTTNAMPQQQPSIYGSVPQAYAITPSLNGFGYQTQNAYTLPQYSTPALSGQMSLSGGMLGGMNSAGSVSASAYDMGGGPASVLTTSYGAQPAGYGYAGVYQTGLQYPGVYQTGVLSQASLAPSYQATGMSTVGINTPLAVKTAASPQREGPPGANLFIYHLPADFGDQELSAAFQPFGNVISAKVFVDKATGLSKCFGFVSYDSPDASSAAINAMNGSQLRGKRLKVQLKRDSRQSKPY